MESIIKDRLREIELALQNKDLNRVSRRLLDYSFEFDLPEQIQDKAIKARINYNLNKQLGSSGNENEALFSDYQKLLETVESIECSADFNSNIPEIICEVKGIAKDFGNKNSFKLNPINLTLNRGNIIGLVGENGNGKTTLLRLIGTDLLPTEGKISVFEGGKELESYEEVKEKVAFIPQRIDRWWGTVESQISFCASIKGLNGKENQRQTQFIIHRLGLTNFQNHKWSELSSGYKLRVEIAKTLVWSPKVLILDEPLANLDLLAQELLLQDLRDLANSLKRPVTIILSSQQLHEVETVANQIIFLKNGRSVFNGNIEDIKGTDNSTTVELDGDFSYNTLSEIFKSIEIKVEQNSSGFTIYASNEVSAQSILQLLVESKIEITYFRDITNSTKKLFNDKY